MDTRPGLYEALKAVIVERTGMSTEDLDEGRFAISLTWASTSAEKSRR